MKILQYHQEIRLSFVILASFFSGLVIAQTNSASCVEAHGAQTNGISAWIQAWQLHGEQVISLGVTIPSADVKFTNAWKNTVGWWRFKYFEATNFKTSNSFWGPIELEDVTGHRVPLLEPAIDFADAYPATNSVKTAERILMTKYGYSPYNGPSLPAPLIGRGTTIPFHLKDYFKLEKPGEYKLTVWPKIYRRISPTNDICQRIDLPPVTIPIQWKGRQ